MADQSTILRVRAEVENLEGLNRLRTAVRGVSSEAKAGSNDFNRLLENIRSLDGAATRSISGLQRQRDAFEAIRRSANLGSDAFKQATAEITRLDQKLQQVESRQAAGGGIGRLTKTLGAAASGGIFGGPEGFIGGIAGGIVGGPGGALAGAAIGAQVSILRQQAGAIAEQVAELTRYRIALAGVSKDQKDYNQSIQDVTKFSKQFLLPLNDATQQYTKLKASIAGAGLTTKETTQVFQGIAAAVIATGGKTEDLNSALRATAQVFSKGKVSAEELRQQIGERLPGAFTIFAQATGRTPQQLDKALEEGKVSLSDFLKFTDELYRRYAKTSEILAAAPENAGARLKVALDFATVAFGGFFQNVGAGFQTYAANLLAFTLDNQEKIKTIVATITVAAEDIISIFSGLIKALVPIVTPFFTFIFENFARGVNALRALADLSARSAGTPEQRAAKQVEALYPNFIERALKGSKAYQEALRVELAYQKDINKELETRDQRIKRLSVSLFKPFTPTSFGTGLGKPIGLDQQSGTEGSKEKKGKKIVDLTKEELDLLKEIDRLQNKGLDLQADLVQFKLDELQTSLQLQRNEIGNNRGIADSLKNQQKLAKAVEAAFKGYGNELIKAYDTQTEINRIIQDAEIKSGKITQEEARQLLINRQIADFKTKYPLASDEDVARLRKALEQADKAKTFAENFKASFKSVSDAALNLGANLGASLGNAFLTLGDQIAEFAMTGKANFAEMTRSILADLAKIFARAAIFASLKAVFQGSSIGGLFNFFAMGGVMTPSGPMPLKRYATGGIANSPQLAMFGEGRQPEAYVPLPDGRSIPVTMQGGGQGVNVVVNVDAAGSAVQGDGPNAKALGVAISSAVKAEILKQQRPGGYLAGTR